MADEQEAPAPAPAAELPERANERIQTLIGEKKSLAQQLAEARALSASHETALSELRSRYDAESAGWTQERAFLGAGITDTDTQEVILARHDKLGEGAPALAAWLTDGAAQDPIVSRLLTPAASASPRLPAETGAQPSPAIAATGSREDYMRQYREVQTMRKGPEKAAALQRLASHPYLIGG